MRSAEDQGPSDDPPADDATHNAALGILGLLAEIVTSADVTEALTTTVTA